MVGAAPSVRKAELGALLAPDRKTDTSQSAFIVALCGTNFKDFSTSRTADQLSLHHDSQFSAFSTEVLVRQNRDTIAVVLPMLP